MLKNFLLVLLLLASNCDSSHVREDNPKQHVYLKQISVEQIYMFGLLNSRSGQYNYDNVAYSNIKPGYKYVVHVSGNQILDFVCCLGKETNESFNFGSEYPLSENPCSSIKE